MLDSNNQRLNRLLCVCTDHYVCGDTADSGKVLKALFDDEVPSEKYLGRLVQQFSYI